MHCFFDLIFLNIYTVCYRKEIRYANKRRLMQGVMRLGCAQGYAQGYAQGLCAGLCAWLCARVMRMVMRMVLLIIFRHNRSRRRLQAKGLCAGGVRRVMRTTLAA